MGSLLAALVSYLDARKNNGQWLVRIEDIDPPREQPGSAKKILQTLEHHGLHWDQEVRFQSSCSSLYEEKLETLISKELCYFCPCSRKQLNDNAGEHLPSCGKLSGKALKDSALRFHSRGQTQHWNDLILGSRSEVLDADFILKRRDGLYSYQLAVVADDIDQQITHVIRGADLLDSTPMQLALYSALDTHPPKFGHFPLVVNAQGQKLSKQNLAPAVSDQSALDNLELLGKWLGFELPVNPSHPDEYLISYTEQWGLNAFKTRQDYVV